MEDKLAETLIKVLERATNVEVYGEGDEPNYFQCSYCIEDNMECPTKDGGINHAAWCDAKKLYDDLVKAHPDLDPDNPKNRCIDCGKALKFYDRPGPGRCFDCRMGHFEKQ